MHRRLALVAAACSSLCLFATAAQAADKEITEYIAEDIGEVLPTKTSTSSPMCTAFTSPCSWCRRVTVLPSKKVQRPEACKRAAVIDAVIKTTERTRELSKI